MPRTSLPRLAARVVVGLLAIAAAVYALGPRIPYSTEITFDASTIGADVETYINEVESAWNDIRPGAERQIVWHDPTTRKTTDYSIVYLHGFSASAGEVRPLPDKLAAALGANLYFARFKGHGRTAPNALAEGTVHDWMNDFAEAIEIGKRLGRKVILISTSTGGSVATVGLARNEFAKEVAAAVFISPNYGIQADGAFLMLGPWARQITHAILGERRTFEPRNELHAQISTYDYPVDALFPMIRIATLASDSDVEDISVPALFIYSSLDEVVLPEVTSELADRWGGPREKIDVGNGGEKNHHVLAGDAMSPQMTDPLVEKTLDWLGNTLDIANLK